MSILERTLNYIENKFVKYIYQNILLLYLGSFFLIAIFAYFVLIHFPNSADEYAYVFQSMTFRTGHLWNDIHPLQDFFNYIHIFAQDGKWVSRFPPGYPIVLTIADFLYIPFWLVNPILSGLVLWVFFVFTKKIHGVTVATIATLSLLFSSFFIINGASFFSHMFALLLILLFYYYSVLFSDTGRWKYAVLAGFWIGFAFITRPYSSILLATPLFFFFLFNQPKRTIIGAFGVIVGAIPFLTFLFYYNYEVTGDPFTMVTQWLHSNERIGFVNGHTWGRAVDYTKLHLRDMLFCSSPFLLFLLISNIFYVKNKNNGTYASWIILEFSIFTIAVIGYAFYYTYGGNQYGPRFYFEGYPFAIIAVTAMVFNKNEIHGKRILISKFLYIVGFFIAVILIPFHSWKVHKIIYERTDLYRLSELSKLDNSIVIVSSSTGVVRPMHPGDLTRNGISIDKNILYVRDRGIKSYEKLHKFFPTKKIYRYIREKNSSKGRLIKLP